MGENLERPQIRKRFAISTERLDADMSGAGFEVSREPFANLRFSPAMHSAERSDVTPYLMECVI